MRGERIQYSVLSTQYPVPGTQYAIRPIPSRSHRMSFMHCRSVLPSRAPRARKPRHATPPGTAANSGGPPLRRGGEGAAPRLGVGGERGPRWVIAIVALLFGGSGAAAEQARPPDGQVVGEEQIVGAIERQTGEKFGAAADPNRKQGARPLAPQESLAAI